MLNLKTLLPFFFISFVCSCSKNNPNSSINDMTVFRTLDTSLNPIAGVKVTLFEIHENGLYYVYIKKDSAISNQMGYTSFDGLSQDYSYRPFASKDCFNSEMMPNIFKMKIQPNRIDTFDIYLTQTGYLKLTCCAIKNSKHV